MMAWLTRKNETLRKLLEEAREQKNIAEMKLEYNLKQLGESREVNEKLVKENLQYRSENIELRQANDEKAAKIKRLEEQMGLHTGILDTHSAGYKQHINSIYGTKILNEKETKMAMFNLHDTNEKKVPEEWVWVEGYKGTDKTLGCRGYQYEMHNVHTMSKDAEISECRSGFHFCIELRNVFDYYNIKNGNRFFRVRAEVKKSDLDKYYEKYKIETNAAYPDSVIIGDPIKGLGGSDKLAARSIEFLYELTPDDIFKAYKDGKHSDWSLEDKKLAMEIGLSEVHKMHDLAELEELGYSKPFAAYLIMNGMFGVAKAIGSQKDLSMDMKVMVIFSHIGSDRGPHNYYSADATSSAFANVAASAARLGRR